MNAEQLRALQAPVKDRYRAEPAAALVTFHSRGQVIPADLQCAVETSRGRVVSGLHPAAGGNLPSACSGDLFLDALVACAGVTLSAVATAMGISLRSGEIQATAQADFRGTLGIDRSVPVGITDVQLTFHLDADAEPQQLEKLVQLTERYCVVLQTLRQTPRITTRIQQE